MSDVIDTLGMRGVATVPAKIWGHSMLVIDIFTCNTGVLRRVAEDFADLRPGERLPNVRLVEDRPRPPQHFIIYETPSDFLTRDESRQQFDIISDIGEARYIQ